MRSLSSSEECIFRKGRPNRRNLRDENRSAFSTRTISRPDKRPKEVETLYFESSKDCRRSSKTSKKRNGKSEESNINQRENLDKSEEVSSSAKSSFGPTFMATGSSWECSSPNFSPASQKLSSETLKAYATALGIKTDHVACEDNRSVGGTNPQKLSAETILAYQTALGIKADQTNEGGQNLFGTSSPKLSTKAFRAYSKTPGVCADLEDEKYQNTGHRLVQRNDECKIGNQMESRGPKIFGVSNRKRSTDCFDHCRDHGTAVEKIGGKLVATPSSSDLEDTLRGLNLDEMNEEQLRKLYDYETSSSRNFSSYEVESAHTCEIGRKFKAKPGSNPARKPISSWHGTVDHGSDRPRSPCTVTVKSNINADFGRSISGVGALSRTTPKSCGREVKDYGDHISRRPKIESRSFDRGRERFAPEVKRFGACDQEIIKPVVQVYESFGPSKANGMQARWEVDSSGPSSTWKRLPPETACHQRCPQSMIGSEVKSLGSFNRAGFEPVRRCHWSNRKRPDLGMVVSRCDQRSFETGNPKLLQTRPDSAVTRHTNFNQKLSSPEMVSMYIDEKILPKRCDQERFHPEKPSKNFDPKNLDPKMRPRHSNCDQFNAKITEPKHLSRKQLEASNNGSKDEYRRLSGLDLSGHPRLTPLESESSKRSSLTSPLDNKASMQFCQMLAKSLPNAKIIPFKKLSEILPEAELSKVNEKINRNIDAKQVSPCLFDDTQLHIDRIKQQVLEKAKECLPNATFSKINQFLLNSKSESEPELIHSSMSPSESKEAISSVNDLQTSGRASSFHQGEASPSRTSPKQRRKLKKCSSYYNYMYPVGNQRRRSGKTTKRTGKIEPKAQTKEQSKTTAERRPTNSKAKRQPARSSSSEDTSKVCNSEVFISSLSNSCKNRLSSGRGSDASLEASISSDDGELIFMEYDSYDFYDYLESSEHDHHFATKDLGDLKTVGYQKGDKVSFQNVSYVDKKTIENPLLGCYSDNIGYLHKSDRSPPFENQLNFLLNHHERSPRIVSHPDSYNLAADIYESCVVPNNDQNSCKNHEDSAITCDGVFNRAENDSFGINKNRSIDSGSKIFITDSGTMTSCQSCTRSNQLKNKLSFEENRNFPLTSYSLNCAKDEKTRNLKSSNSSSNQCQSDCENLDSESFSSSSFPGSAVSSENVALLSDADYFAESNHLECSEECTNFSSLDDRCTFESLKRHNTSSIGVNSPAIKRESEINFYQSEKQSDHWRGLYDPTEIYAKNCSYTYHSPPTEHVFDSDVSQSVNRNSLKGGSILRSASQILDLKNIILTEPGYHFPTGQRTYLRAKPQNYEPRSRNIETSFISAPEIPRFSSSGNRKNPLKIRQKFASYRNIIAMNGDYLINRSAFGKTKLKHENLKRYAKFLQARKRRLRIAVQVTVNANIGSGANCNLLTCIDTKKLLRESQERNRNDNIILNHFPYFHILIRVPGITHVPQICAPSSSNHVSYNFNTTRHPVLSSIAVCPSTAKELCKISGPVENHISQNFRRTTTFRSDVSHFDVTQCNHIIIFIRAFRSYKDFNQITLGECLMSDFIRGHDFIAGQNLMLVCLTLNHETSCVGNTYFKSNENSDSSTTRRRRNDCKPSTMNVQIFIIKSHRYCNNEKTRYREPDSMSASDVILSNSEFIENNTFSKSPSINELSYFLTLKIDQTEVPLSAGHFLSLANSVLFFNAGFKSNPSTVFDVEEPFLSSDQPMKKCDAAHSSIHPGQSTITLQFSSHPGFKKTKILSFLSVISVRFKTDGWKIFCQSKKFAFIDSVARNHFLVPALITRTQEPSLFFCFATLDVDFNDEYMPNGMRLICLKIHAFCASAQDLIPFTSFLPATVYKWTTGSTDLPINQSLWSLSCEVPRVLRSLIRAPNPAFLELKGFLHHVFSPSSIILPTASNAPQFKAQERDNSIISAFSTCVFPDLLLADYCFNNRQPAKLQMCNSSALYPMPIKHYSKSLKHTSQSESVEGTCEFFFTSRDEQYEQSLHLISKSIASSFSVPSDRKPSLRFELFGLLKNLPTTYPIRPYLLKIPSKDSEIILLTAELYGQLFFTSCSNRSDWPILHFLGLQTISEPVLFQVIYLYSSLQCEILDFQGSMQIQTLNYQTSSLQIPLEKCPARSKVSSQSCKSITQLKVASAFARESKDHLVRTSMPCDSDSAKVFRMISVSNPQRCHLPKSPKVIFDHRLFVPKVKREISLTKYAQTAEDPVSKHKIKVPPCFPVNIEPEMDLFDFFRKGYVSFSECMHDEYFHPLGSLNKWFFEYHSQQGIRESPSSSRKSRSNPQLVETTTQTDFRQVDSMTQTNLCLVSPRSFENFLFAQILSWGDNFNMST